VAASKILVVDDDPDIRRIAGLALERIGRFRVVLAENGEAGLALAVSERPDLVLLDVSMPGADGPAILAALRAAEATRNLPVVFFTAASNDAEVARLRSLGAAGVVPKPFDVAELPRLVHAILAELGLS
jgi:CheY-like chemotaxis protein